MYHTPLPSPDSGFLCRPTPSRGCVPEYVTVQPKCIKLYFPAFTKSRNIGLST